MSRPHAVDPLVPMPIRIPASLHAQITAAAKAADVSRSDIVRARFKDAENVKPLGRPTPRKAEQRQRVTHPGVAPELLFQMAEIGNNLNQIARAVNTAQRGGEPVPMVELLLMLKSISDDMASIREAHTRAPVPDSDDIDADTMA